MNDIGLNDPADVRSSNVFFASDIMRSLGCAQIICPFFFAGAEKQIPLDFEI
jgi:hypothetical protein